MAKVMKEISVITGRYTNKDGQEENRYTRVGSIIDTKNGPMLKLDVIPLKENGWDGWAYINDPYDESKPAKEAPRRNDDLSDIPF